LYVSKPNRPSGENAGLGVVLRPWGCSQLGKLWKKDLEEKRGFLGMRFFAIAGFIVLILTCLPPVFAAEWEGSVPADLAKTRPPTPNNIRVAVLPFWARDDDESNMARACLMLNLLRHGFRMAPPGCRSLTDVARQTDAALRNDRSWDPLARLEASDVARIAAALDADWAVYGQFGELHTESKGSVLPEKTGVLDLHFILVDVKHKKTIYWTRVQDTYSNNKLWPNKASSIERKLVTRTLNAIFDDIALALPEHYSGSEVTSDEVLDLMGAMQR